jgi:hypothetical protein
MISRYDFKRTKKTKAGINRRGVIWLFLPFGNPKSGSKLYEAPRRPVQGFANDLSRLTNS